MSIQSNLAKHSGKHPLHLKPVRQQLAVCLREAMLKCFPLEYDTDITDQSKPSFEKLLHMSQSNGFGNKSQFCDYFSCTPQLIFDTFVTPEVKAEGLRGYYGLPEAREVAQDLIAQMMTPGQISQSMEVNQFFFGKKGLTAEQRLKGFVDGFHVDIVLRDQFLNQYIQDKREELLMIRKEQKKPIILRLGNINE